MNTEDCSIMSVQSTLEGSSSSTSSSSDMTLPTPPRSPSASVGFGFDETMQDLEAYENEEYYRSQSIPEPLLDDLLELWYEEADYNAVKSAPETDKSGSGTTTKKTIGIALTNVAPNKKIIRFTDSDTVKDVPSTDAFQSAAIVADQNSSSTRTITTGTRKPNHNVRKSPHPKSSIIETISALDDLDSNSPMTSFVSATAGSSSSSLSHSSSNSSSSSSSKAKRKKYKAREEKIRRRCLKNSTSNLEKLVLPPSEIPNCTKLRILRKTEEYIKGLENQVETLKKEKMQVQQRNAQLRRILGITSSSSNDLTGPGSNICIFLIPSVNSC